MYNVFNIITAKEEALKELRSAHPNHVIDVHLPNYCSEHVDKITEVHF